VALRIGIAIVGVAAVAWLATSIDPEVLTPERITAFLETTGMWAPLVFVGVMALAVVVSPIPSLPLDIAAGAFFGWFGGGLLALLGATLGAAVSFAIARWLGREFVERIVGGHVSFCSECSDMLLTGAVLGARLVPVLSFDLVSYGAGLTAMSLPRFVLATALGSAPLTFLYTWAGPQIWSRIVDWGWLAIPVVAALLVVPRLLEKRGKLPVHEH
jgi:uncharacterized membrane protein YdjX (TVP38/TMEM64 family)